MKLDAYCYTNPGGRAENEDAADYLIADSGGIFVLADGLGGHRDGAEASARVVGTLLEAWRAEPPTGETGALEAWLHGRLLDANRALLEEQKGDRNGRKSTALALVLDGAGCAWSHVGDSRLYHISNGRLRHATQDHSVTYKKYLAGEIGREDINFDDDRSSLLRVVGDEARCLPEEGTLEGCAAPGDAFLLCSDGFWEYLYDEEILADRLKAETPEEWAELMLLRLLPRMRPDSDNLTLLAVFVV